MSNFLKKTLITGAVSIALLTTSIGFAKTAPKDVLTNYSNIAHAGFEDSLITAKALQKAVNALTKYRSNRPLHAQRYLQRLKNSGTVLR